MARSLKSQMRRAHCREHQISAWIAMSSLLTRALSCLLGLSPPILMEQGRIVPRSVGVHGAPLLGDSLGATLDIPWISSGWINHPPSAAWSVGLCPSTVLPRHASTLSSCIVSCRLGITSTRRGLCNWRLDMQKGVLV